MKKLLICLLLASCAKEETIPIFKHSAERVGDRIVIKVVSELPSVEICITDEKSKRCFEVVKHYYNCIRIEAQGEAKIEIFAEDDEFKIVR